MKVFHKVKTTDFDYWLKLFYSFQMNLLKNFNNFGLIRLMTLKEDQYDESWYYWNIYIILQSILLDINYNLNKDDFSVYSQDHIEYNYLHLCKIVIDHFSLVYYSFLILKNIVCYIKTKVLQLKLCQHWKKVQDLSLWNHDKGMEYKFRCE